MVTRFDTFYCSINKFNSLFQNSIVQEASFSVFPHDLTFCEFELPQLMGDLDSAKFFRDHIQSLSETILHLVEHVDVEKVAGDVYRHKRSAIVFPEAMQFQFRLQAGDVEMNLEKAAIPSAPVYTVEPSGFIQRDQPIKVSSTFTLSISQDTSIVKQASR